MQYSRIISATVLLIGVGVLALHAASSEKLPAKERPETPYRYTAVELAEEAIDAYEALGTNDVASAREILLHAIVNYIEDDERGGATVKSDTKIDEKAKLVRDRFRTIYAELITSQK